MVIFSGNITLNLNSQGEKTFSAGSIIVIPYKTKMNIENKSNGPAEFFIFKAPIPKALVNGY